MLKDCVVDVVDIWCEEYYSHPRRSGIVCQK